ncbi:hypothetical protein WR25_27193 [Diploscapter pachys]|uniref:Pseudouridine synthase II N-terminal domain-containing protein n=1 Tax=Diploscapter pachys TaxID=2018661 RepID=A0A2A2L9I3_9BILA|nr:hypothetical protein WR25_27193 [Diploscapter pachys]
MHRRLSQALNGLICVHKPQERPLKRICRVLAKTLAEEASQAVGPIQRPLIKLPYVESHESGALLVVGENETEDYRYAPLISGAAFRPEDIRIEPLQDMETTSTGVCVLGVNDGCDELPKLMANSWLSEYRLEGLLGFERVDNRLDTKVNIRAPFDHVNKFMMSKFLARLESEYRKLAFHTANVDLQSEEAFEMARKGLPRTQLPGQTIIYKLELRHFNPPFFTLNVQCTGETDKFMRLFVHEIGLSLGTTASCVRMQR